MSTRAYAYGDRLTHASKPEWGVGEVVAAQSVTQNGAPCQRLQVRFERAGLKTVSTAVADLRPAGSVEVNASGAGPAEEPVDLSDPQEAMSRVPEAATDPFASPVRRLEATLDLYKYKPQGASLLDWAATQSGLADPLSRFNRHELEAFFDRFRHNLDQHLGKLLKELRRQDAAAVDRIASKAPSEGRDAVKRLHARG